MTIAINVQMHQDKQLMPIMRNVSANVKASVMYLPQTNVLCVQLQERKHGTPLLMHKELNARQIKVFVARF